MLIAGLIAAAVLTQSSTPSVEPGSIYGMKTYTTNPEFGFLPDKFVLGFAPENMDQITMHVLKGSDEVVGGGFYPTETPYPAFRVLRFQPVPTVNLAEPGDYKIEFRNSGSPISVFPFKIERKQGGDEFNPTIWWDFITPVDKMGSLSVSNTEDAQVWMNAWLAPRRDGYPMGSFAQISLSHGGKEVAFADPLKFQEQDNIRRGFKLMLPGGRADFKKSHLMALSGAVTGTIKHEGKTIRTFTWTVSGGKVAPFARSASDFTPRTDYWMPRRLAAAAEGRQFYHLEEHYWAQSK